MCSVFRFEYSHYCLVLVYQTVHHFYYVLCLGCTPITHVITLMYFTQVTLIIGSDSPCLVPAGVIELQYIRSCHSHSGFRILCSSFSVSFCTYLYMWLSVLAGPHHTSIPRSPNLNVLNSVFLPIHIMFTYLGYFGLFSFTIHK